MRASEAVPTVSQAGTTRRVAVGVDSERTGAAALAWATEEVLAAGGRLTICHARPDDRPDDRPDELPDDLPGAPPPALSALELTRPDLARGIRWCRQRIGDTTVAVELPAGDTATALLALSRRCDLLVIGAPAAPGHRTVVAEVAARCSCPLVVVRPAAGDGRAPFAGHVVVAVDDSAAAAAGLRFGFDYAVRHHQPLAAVHVERQWAGDYWFDDGVLETHFAAEPPALERLAQQVEPFAARYPTVAVKRAVFAGGVLAGLRRSSAGAALLVLAQRHRSGPRTGSVTRAFAERAACTVAIVPGPAATR